MKSLLTKWEREDRILRFLQLTKGLRPVVVGNGGDSPKFLLSGVLSQMENGSCRRKYLRELMQHLEENIAIGHA